MTTSSCAAPIASTSMTSLWTRRRRFSKKKKTLRRAPLLSSSFPKTSQQTSSGRRVKVTDRRIYLFLTAGSFAFEHEVGADGVLDVVFGVEGGAFVAYGVVEDEAEAGDGVDGVEDAGVAGVPVQVGLAAAAVDVVEVQHAGVEGPLGVRAREGAVVVGPEVVALDVAEEPQPLVEADGGPALLLLASSLFLDDELRRDVGLDPSPEGVGERLVVDDAPRTLARVVLQNFAAVADVQERDVVALGFRVSHKPRALLRRQHVPHRHGRTLAPACGHVDRLGSHDPGTEVVEQRPHRPRNHPGDAPHRPED
mmetsp:Transcript_4453/g.14783  ORF Transcript_4453/g.14783 Transcript_4453/m.14783 type:complete len:309 (-) Transcript_4453:46-972(-)